MSVYVDDMMREVRLGRFPAKWSHLMADTSGELMLFAMRLGLEPSWLQHPLTHREHFDVTMAVRAKALALGAVPISYPRGTADLLARKRSGVRAEGGEAE